MKYQVGSKQRKKGIDTWKYNDTDERMMSTGGNNKGTFGEFGKANKRSVWTVTTKPFSEAHFAVYPEDLITPCILTTKKDAIIYDPFGGAGTTGVVALRAGRKFIMLELNPEYVKIAEKRLQPYLHNLFTMCELKEIELDTCKTK